MSTTNGDHNGDLPVYNLYITGHWRTPVGEQYRPAIDPSNGERLALIAQADIEDTRLAIQAARDAFDDGYWAGMAPGERSRLLVMNRHHSDGFERIEGVEKMRDHPP